jgi:hypothetical protein
VLTTNDRRLAAALTAKRFQIAAARLCPLPAV